MQNDLNRYFPQQHLGGAHGNYCVNWQQIGEHNWRLVPDPDLPETVRAEFGSALGEVTFHPLEGWCEIVIYSRQGDEWEASEPAQSDADARALLMEAIANATANPIRTTGFDALHSWTSPADDMSPRAGEPCEYALEWCDRMARAINDLSAARWAIRSEGMSTKAVAASEASAAQLADQCARLAGVFERGLISTSSREGARAYALLDWANGLLRT